MRLYSTDEYLLFLNNGASKTKIEDGKALEEKRCNIYKIGFKFRSQTLLCLSQSCQIINCSNQFRRNDIFGKFTNTNKRG